MCMYVDYRAGTGGVWEDCMMTVPVIFIFVIDVVFARCTNLDDT